MQNAPDEIISEIIGHLDFGAINPFARAYRQATRLTTAVAVKIADKNSKVDSFLRYDPLTCVSLRRLPNGILHGTAQFNRDDTISFRVDYDRGTPTYWRAVDNRGDVDQYTWGHMSLPYYVHSYESDGSGMWTSARVRVGKRKYIVCYRVGPSEYWKNDDSRAVDFAPAVPPPKIFLIDGNICVHKVEVWGRQIMYHSARTTRPPTIFDGREELANLIREICPGVRSLFWTPDAK